MNKDYYNFKIDEPVMVRITGLDWRRRHFAGVSEDGLPMAWNNGITSWTTNNKEKYKSCWDDCRRPTEEELTIFQVKPEELEIETKYQAKEL